MMSKLRAEKIIDVQSMGECGPKKNKLISIGISPTGYISIGIAPMGIIAIGIVPMGLISFGTVAMGAVATGLVSMGIAAFGIESMSLFDLERLQFSSMEIKSELHHYTDK